MTLSELIEQALAELEHPADTASRPLWEEKLTRYANEAQADLFFTLRPWRRETLQLANGTIALSDAQYRVSKVLGVEREGMRLPFYYGADTKTLHLKGVPDGPVQVVYRYIPSPLSEANDEPQLPSVCHPLIVMYMVARFEMHNDAPGLSHANMLMALYDTNKRRLRMDLDEPCGYDLHSRY